MRTKYSVAEEIQRIVNGGFPSDRDRIGIPELYPKIESEGAKYMKAGTLDTNFNGDGNSYTAGLMVAPPFTVPVTQVPGYAAGEVFSQFQLPVAPMVLPEGQGIANVYPTGFPFRCFYYIPREAYQQQRESKHLSKIAQTFYMQQGMTVTIDADLVGANIPTVDVEIAAPALDQLSEFAPLPLPADIISNIISGVVAMYATEPRTERSEALQPNPSKGD